MISRTRQTAIRASVPAIREGLGHACSAEARLAGSASISFPEIAPGACSLVRDEVQEHRPCSIVNGLRKHPGGESLHVQIFYGNQPILVDNLARLFVNEIRSLVANANIRPLEQLHCFAAAVAPLLAPCNFALAAPQSGLCIPVAPGVLNLGSIGQHREAVQANVDTDLFRGNRQRLSLALDAEAHEPASSFPLDRGSFDLSCNGAVQFDLDVPCAMHANLTAGKQAASCRMLREGEAIVSPGRAEAGKARLLLAALHAGKERRERFIHTAQNVLRALGIDQRPGSRSSA
jgi:hypothetical protein